MLYKPPKLVAADIETDGLGGDFIQAATWDGQELKYYDTIDHLWLALCDNFPKHEILFHNADYDLRYLIPLIERMAPFGYTAEITVDGREHIIYVRLLDPDGKKVLNIRDTYATLSKPLKDLAQLAGMEKLDIGLKEGVTFNPLDPLHMSYLERDVVMLYNAYSNYLTSLRTHWQITPGYTAGSTAVKAFRRTLTNGDVHFRHRSEVEAFCREAYFGGLTFVRSIAKHSDVIKIDANAMYATCMRNIGAVVSSAAHVYSEYPGYPGIYLCSVYCPYSVPFTFIPMRQEYDIMWPRGYFETHLPTNSIELARQVGYEVDVIEGYVWPATQPIFSEFVSRCESMEREYKGQGVYEIVKLMRNSLYGKFGQRAQGKSYYITDRPTPEMTPAIDTDGDDINHLYYLVEDRQQAHMMIAWATWVTAEARNTLARMVYALGPENCIYGDTDSIVVKATPEMLTEIPLGPSYGQWKVEAHYQEFQALAPKLYIGRHDDEWELRHKGVPKGTISVEELQAIAEGKKHKGATYHTLPKSINTTDGRKKVSREVARTIQTMYNSDKWYVDRDSGIVSPITLGKTYDGQSTFY